MIELRNVSKRFGGTLALDGVSLTIPNGSFTTLLGPSGCGKSTTLRILAGLVAPTSGEVRFDGRDVRTLGPAARNVAMVFQSYALYPHLTVAQNIALPLAMRELTRLERAPLVGRLLPRARAKRRAVAERVREAAEALDIEALLARKPSELSGGQKQRAALGRALVRDPSVFLLDEPLSNLDARLRVHMRAELTALHRSTGVAFVYVTHDQVEAMAMSDRVAVFMDGRIAQVGSPREIYGRPASLAVAGFVGTHPINALTVDAAAGRLGAPFEGAALAGADRPGRVVVGIRPEDVALARGDGAKSRPCDGRSIALAARVADVEFLGADAIVSAHVADGTLVRAEMKAANALPEPGARVELRFDAADAHVFDAESGERIDASLTPAGAGSSAALRALP